ncbi:BREX-1 system adenine-specific DNA-methyltransferase PglX [Levilactobacillus yonginensis]|uniref:BREX-1 system adenine-specific DNA-methyltransferase PglX n=1 Tax=Levilactobacillus yonginensis TaxID=1054041 RepID=UPI000F7A5616|nr:BREX-1 system adenine-specific DNA-methyltransferase PglX [Levilactobacillus yonginensis]
MDKTAIKKFAIEARRSLIESIQLKAATLGITKDGVGDKLSISTSEIEYYVDDQSAITGKDISKRQKLVAELEQRAQKSDFATAFRDLVEEVAYTWFNRIIAIRFMEVNDYLPSRTRVLSSTENRNEPDIMLSALDVEDDLGGFSSAERSIIDKAQDTELPSDMDAEYQMLFIKQANALNKNLPYLFEKTNDYAELLFTPSYHDGVIQHLITDVSEDDFNVAVGGQVEIIGWLYQYYNTEPKDRAFKKKKYLESDIPAVTQLFTPDWIVKYMVENSLGRYWIQVLQAKGDQRSGREIAAEFSWNYFMAEAQQSESVIVKSSENDLANENIEQITLIDAAMGSGHILIYAFDVFMQIYEQEGYSHRDAAKLIVQHNLFGLDIDTRAFQLAYFSLMMKARETNRRFLTLAIRPNVFDIPDSGRLSSGDYRDLLQSENEKEQLDELLDEFRQGNEYGSLIQPKPSIDWSVIDEIATRKMSTGQLSLNSVLLAENQGKLKEISNVGKVLAKKFTIGAMNPPYMGSGKMDSVLGGYVKKTFPNSKADLFAVFMERLRTLTKEAGYYAMITQHAWMFLSSFEKLRGILKEDTLVNMAHLGTRAFEEIGGEVVQSTTFVFKRETVPDYVGTYERLVGFDSQQKKEHAYLEAVLDPSVDYLYRTNQANFAKIPGMPIAYWIKAKTLEVFSQKLIKNYTISDGQTKTGNNSKYLRLLWEVSANQIGSSKRWVIHAKGGSFRRWYGNLTHIIDWSFSARSHYKNDNVARIAPDYIWFRKGITWTLISADSRLAVRVLPETATFNLAAPSLFAKNVKNTDYLLGFLNSKAAAYIRNIYNPTLNTNISDITNIPLKVDNTKIIEYYVEENIQISKKDWDAFETSWNFKNQMLLTHIADDKRTEVDGKLKNAFKIWQGEARERFDQLKANEEELNRIFIDLYGLNDELTPEVADKDVSVRLADEVRDIKSFLSYFVGVVFGRYSLDVEGLAYAGGDWIQSNYQTFVPNEDNLLLLNDDDYFGDSRDIINRLRAFLGAAFGTENIQDNLDYIASVVGKRADSSEASIRRYFVDDFFKDHSKIYQKRPIYWEFNSGKRNGFKALMYLHRYDKNELAMIRTNYLHPLQGKYEQKISQLSQLLADENVVSQKKKYEKKLKHLNQQLTEIKKYDPIIQHIANQQISLDLDDGVLVNYSKLQDGTTILSKLK